MKEYIEREAAETAVANYFGFTSARASVAAEKILSTVPAADVVEVRHGRWIEDGDYQYCSECGEEHCWIDYRATYCDACGAKMDGGADDA